MRWYFPAKRRHAERWWCPQKCTFMSLFLLLDWIPNDNKWLYFYAHYVFWSTLKIFCMCFYLMLDRMRGYGIWVKKIVLNEGISNIYHVWLIKLAVYLTLIHKFTQEGMAWNRFGIKYKIIASSKNSFKAYYGIFFSYLPQSKT